MEITRKTTSPRKGVRRVEQTADGCCEFDFGNVIAWSLESAMRISFGQSMGELIEVTIEPTWWERLWCVKPMRILGVLVRKDLTMIHTCLYTVRLSIDRNLSRLARNPVG